MRRITVLLAVLASALLGACSHTPSQVSSAPRPPVEAPSRTIHADVVALDQVLTYNRFGSINPYAMIYALRRDVVASNGSGELAPGKVRMAPDKRPRPLVLRGNEGDELEVRFTNLLRPSQPDTSSCDAVPCTPPYANLKEEEDLAEEEEERDDEGSVGKKAKRTNDWPATRNASIVVPGLESANGTDPRCTGLVSIPVGETITCRWKLTREGSFLFYSQGAPGGGEADSGSLIHGLFGVVTVEPRGSRWYRSQVTAETFDAAWKPKPIGDGTPGKARDGPLDYAKLDILEPRSDGGLEIAHSDVNAIVHECALPETRNCSPGEADAPAFREFTVVFHDELKTFYADPFTELESARQFQGIGDGFAINYGASGMGTALLANRKGIGPAADCVECVYEEFFLQSWANGDPALLETFRDDPSNVHHSYLNDRVRFRNLHAGKETHVFHLHAHQWESPADDTRGSYLDSQTIGPEQAFAYEIYRGGLRHYGSAGELQTNGSGNRNRTIGDSIFHCHLYPHFAQGMWALWRTHDVLEDGMRRLPDGQANAAPSVTRISLPTSPRPGTDPLTGVTGAGTPIPAVVPLPGYALPLLPTYGEAGMPGYPFYVAGKPGHRAPQPPMDFAKKEDGSAMDGGLPRHIVTGGTRGAAHLTAAEIAAIPADKRGDRMVKRALALGDFTAHLETAHMRLLAADGEPLERAAMDFHAGKTANVLLADGSRAAVSGGLGYPSLFADRAGSARFFVNGSAPQPGAPFADPCSVGGRWDPGYNGTTRHYRVSAVQLDLVTNSAGWHDPQARINVLTRDTANYEGRTRGAEPFFFRAESGECIVFNHSNRTPKDLALDDFQVATPTDTIGQHIHLVKFDVTSSDGSGNGWNYEDGTFAPDAVHERICAANKAGGAIDGSARRTLATPIACEGEHAFEDFLAQNMVQTTVQRWFADPLLTGKAGDRKTRDRTLRTVFTHDHFGPSSIQQHGFYSALLIEPKGSQWLMPDGTPMERDPADSAAVGPRALIKGADQSDAHPDVREFALAIADFATLYDPRTSGEPSDKGLDGQQVAAASASDVVTAADRARLAALKADVRAGAGRPVDPPHLPESISTDHHNPYLVNYRGEPIPLRIGERASTAHRIDCAALGGAPIDLRPRPASDISRQRAGLQGDMGWAFASDKAGGHGDPCTPILESYEGERIQLRLVQGAQEVQHTLNVDGLGWSRLPDYALGYAPTPAVQARENNVLGYVGAQEVGISEHFEFNLPALHGVAGGLKQADYLYHFGSQDALWNGAWGLLRAYSGRRQGLAPLYDGDGLSYLVPGGANSLAGSNGAAKTCPAGDTAAIVAVATRVDRLTGGQGLTYRAGTARTTLVDPDALILLPADMALVTRTNQPDAEASWRALDEWIAGWRALPGNDLETLEPFVARVRAGDCVQLRVINALRSHADVAAGKVLPDAVGDADMPRITSLNVGGGASEASGSVRPGADISFTLPLVWQDVSMQFARAIGKNVEGMESDAARKDMVPQMFAMQFYAGRAEVTLLTDAAGKPKCGREETGGRACEFDAKAVPYAFGTLPLKPLGDIAGHISHGLWGSIIVEPAGSSFHDPRSGERVDGMQEAALGAEAIVCIDGVASGLCPEGKSFREFTLFYQDGLNLHWASPWDRDTRRVPVGDCPVCDDSYDLGEKGLNYRSEPFWARLRDGGQDVGPGSNLNMAQFPRDFLMKEHWPIATPEFRAIAGEEIRFRVLHPGGRARQRAFIAGGHDYIDLMAGFGSPGSALMAPGKAYTARIERARAGCYLYRDGPAQIFTGGVWGSLRVDPAPGDTVQCPY